MVEGDPSVCGHVISTTASGGSNRQSINYSTERVVGNGSFGVVFQATCLETGETVSVSDCLSYHLLLVSVCFEVPRLSAVRPRLTVQGSSRSWWLVEPVQRPALESVHPNLSPDSRHD